MKTRFALNSFRFRLSSEFKSHDGRPVLLVRGANSYRSSGAEALVQSVVSNQELVEWAEFSPNPSIEELRVGLDIARELKPSLILGIGGGSAMDLAKMISALWERQDGDEVRVALEGETLHSRSSRLVLLPTTSGSGGEATHFAVLYVDGKKYSLAGPALLPDLAIVDWRLTQSATPVQKANSGIDALCQAIESTWAQRASNRSRRLAHKAIGMIAPSLEEFVRHNSSGSARRMSKGSNLAGQAINISQTTASHALAYKLTSHFSVPHGNAVGLTIGALMDFLQNESSRLEVYQRKLLHRQIRTIRARLRFDSSETATMGFRKLLGSLGLPETLRAAGVMEQSDIELLADSVNPQRLANNPVPLSRPDIIQILEMSWN